MGWRRARDQSDSECIQCPISHIGMSVHIFSLFCEYIPFISLLYFYRQRECVCPSLVCLCAHCLCPRPPNLCEIWNSVSILHENDLYIGYIVPLGFFAGFQYFAVLKYEGLGPEWTRTR